MSGKKVKTKIQDGVGYTKSNAGPPKKMNEENREASSLILLSDGYRHSLFLLGLVSCIITETLVFLCIYRTHTRVYTNGGEMLYEYV